MKALSIRQPYAWLIINGHKDIENRNWQTTFRGRILIHASKTFDPNGESIVRHHTDIKLPTKYDLGGLIGMVMLADCVTEHESGWFEGPYGFVFCRPVKFDRFWPMLGKLGLFETDIDAEVFRDS